MTNKKQIFTFILISFLLFNSVSCGISDGSTKTSDSTDSDSQNTKESMSSLLANLNLGGKTINILDQPCEDYDAFMLNQSDQTGDVLNDAIYKRNIDVEEQLNVKLNITSFIYSKSEKNGHRVSDIFTKMIMAGDTEYDMAFGIQFDVAPIVVNNMFLNLADSAYIDLDKPWWYTDYNNEASVGGRYYLLSGDITLGMLRKTSCMFVNEDLYTQYFGDKSALYDTILSGDWTLNVLDNKVKEVYKDLDGNSVKDDADLYGMITNDVANVDHFTYDAGIRCTSRDKNSLPIITINNETTVAFTEKLYDLFYNNPGTHLYGWRDTDTVMPAKFMNGESVFYPAWFYTAELLRTMEKDFMIIPYPKFDNTIKKYYALAHDTSTVVVVPVNCSKTDDVTAVMEAMAYQGYENILPIYYDTMLKVKYSRDSSDKAMQIIDLIHDSSTTDFGNIYNYALDGAGLIMRNVIGGSKTAFSTYYASKESSIKSKLETLITAMESAN